MGATNLVEYRTKIRLELSDAATFYSNDEIDRAVSKTEALLARLIPKKNIVESTIVIDRTAETIAISSSTGTTAYKPVKYDSETFTNAAGTTMVRGTNYTLNYLTGVITEIGSLLPDAADYAITYKQDAYRLDVSSLITNPIRITKIEYPVGDTPPTFISGYDLIEDYIIFHSENTLQEDKHIRIHYDSQWTAAATTTDGEYPSHLDEVIIIGSAGYVNNFKAEKYVQLSITELGLVNAAADSMATPLSDINTALDKIATEVGYADTALDKVTTHLETGVDDSALGVLAKITDDIAGMRTAILTAQDAANTFLDEVDTTDFGDATHSAEKMLKTPVDSTLINALTTGDKVTQKYTQLAGTWVAIAQARTAAGLAFVEEANSRLMNIRSHVEEALAWVRMGDSFTAEGAQRLIAAQAYAAEASQRVAEVAAWAEQADRYALTSRGYLDIAGRYLASGTQKINEFFVMLGFKPELQHVTSQALQATKY